MINITCDNAINIIVSQDDAVNIITSQKNNELDTKMYPNITLINQSYSTYDRFKYSIELIGIKNGVNSSFNIVENIIPDTEQIICNGNILKKPDDYNISGNNIILSFSPESYEILICNYIKQ